MNREEYKLLIPNKSIVEKDGKFYIFKNEDNFIVHLCDETSFSKIEFLRNYTYTGVEIPDVGFYFNGDKLVFIDYNSVDSICYYGELRFNVYTEEIMEISKTIPRHYTEYIFSLLDIVNLEPTDKQFTVPWNIHGEFLGSNCVNPDFPANRYTKNF